MEQVTFFENNFEHAKEAFLSNKKIISGQLPFADIQHVGSSAIPNCLTKGDLDIQVRVTREQFPTAVKSLDALYEINEGSSKTDYFRAFQDDSAIPPLGIQLTVIDSEVDFFWKFREVLLKNNKYLKEYDELKKSHEGNDMDKYREAKSGFFIKLMETSEYKKL
ncbi:MULTISPECIES: GrpB family protein [Bhargavaea]|uniref:GrpB family protein n=1 Tax=Bhargavaea changchunensis TaxID=2134037 RepID=A0ABW2NJ62_9BACL|nr:GrpB family protein [Bhargavaea sp. CC-171006]